MVEPVANEAPAPARLRWPYVLGVLAGYAVCLCLATYPAVRTPSTRLAGQVTDPLQALRVMRWYRDSLLHGQPLLRNPDIQYPTGAALGNFSPLHFQTLIYLALSLFSGNDVLCYNLMWFGNLLFTGVGTFFLVWHLLRSHTCAAVGGLLALLASPVLLHAHCHLELITLGWCPLFLVGWMRFTDRPTPRRLAAAAGLYLLVTMSAAYLGLFATVPAVGYLVYQAVAQPRREALRWCGRRLAWLAAFTTLLVPCLALLFAGQVWSRTHGYALARTHDEFAAYGVPPWAYFVPSPYQTVGRLLPADLYRLRHVGSIERGSYLGLVTLVLMAAALFGRTRLRHARFCWALFALFVVLSFGACWKVGHVRISLPAEWLYDVCLPARMIRVPARFNLYAALCASVLAAAGLRTLLDRLPRRGARLAVGSGICLLALLELQHVPFATSAVPAPPECYARLLATHPGAAFLEVPQQSSGAAAVLNSCCAYWQAQHHGRTSGGYSGFANCLQDHLVVEPSPFAPPRPGRAGWCGDPERVTCDLVRDVRFDDYAWLYLTVHRFDYVVLHRAGDPAVTADAPAGLGWLERRLGPALAYQDERTAVYDRLRLPPPRRPVLLPTDGWRARTTWQGRPVGCVGRVGRLMVYNPIPQKALVFRIEAASLYDSHTIRLCADGAELARWTVSPQALHDYPSPPLRLPAGLSELTLESDGARPPRREDQAWDRDLTPLSLRVAALTLAAQPGEEGP